MTRPRYRAELDGLRALAVLLVVLYHLDLGIPGGYVGVDVFFVISGYLICQLLVRRVESGQFSWTDFWERRVRRLIPALAVVLWVTAGLGWVLLLPDELARLGRSLVAQVLMVANLDVWKSGQGYFHESSLLHPTLQTWSLAVEEQFYLLFPGLVILGVRWRRMGALVGSLILVSLAACVWTTSSNTQAAYFLLPTRAWELLLGAMAALVHPSLDRLGRLIRESLCVVGLLMIVGSSLDFNRFTRFPGWFALYPTIGATLFILASSDSQRTRTSCAGWMSQRTLVGVGLTSYSLFLWHWPLVSYTRGLWIGDFALPLGVKLLLLAGSLLLGFLSWKYVETPVRDGRLLPTRSSLWLFAASNALLLSCFGAFLWGMKGLPGRWPAAILKLNPLVWSARLDSVDPSQAARGEWNRFGDDKATGSPTFFLWADSHGFPLHNLLDNRAREAGVYGLGATFWGTPPVLKTQSIPGDLYFSHELFAQRAQHVLKAIRDKRVKHVLVVAFWQRYANPGFIENYRHTLEALSQTGAQVWVLRQVPTQNTRTPGRDLVLARYWNWTLPPGISVNQLSKDDHGLEALFKATPRGVHLLDPLPYMREGDTVPYVRGDQLLYFDANHITDAGAAPMGPLFDPLLRP